MHEPSHENPGVGDRLEAIESAQAFTDRTVEQLGEQILELHRRLDGLARSLGQLERRLEEFESGADEIPDGPPPHSSDRKPDRPLPDAFD